MKDFNRYTPGEIYTYPELLNMICDNTREINRLTAVVAAYEKKLDELKTTEGEYQLATSFGRCEIARLTRENGKIRAAIKKWAER